MSSKNVPMKFTDTPILTPDNVAKIGQWYDYVRKASNNRSDVEEIAYYTGATHMANSVLQLINNNAQAEKVVEVVKVVKKNRIFGIRKIYIYIAVGYILYDGRLVKKAKVKFAEIFPDESGKHVDNSKN